MLSGHGRIATLAGIAAALGAACGARSNVLDASATGATLVSSSSSGAGAGGNTSSTGVGAGGESTTSTGVGAGGSSTGGTTTSSTSTGAGGQGGGAPALCETLAWAGEPVFLSAKLGGLAVRPMLIRATGDDAGLVFEELEKGALQLESRVIHPWDGLPSPPGPIGIAMTVSEGTPIAKGPGISGLFTYAAKMESGKMILGITPPGDLGNAQTPVVIAGDAKLVARAPGGAIVVGHGSDVGLSLSVVSGSVPTSLGVLGCASPRVVGEAVSVGINELLVASTNQAPFDDCADPGLPGPPVVVQIAKVGKTSWEPGGYLIEPGPILDLQLAERPGGAWLAYRVDGDPSLRVLKLDADGQIVGQIAIAGAPSDADAVTAWSDGFAHVTTSPGDANAAAFVRLDLVAATANASLAYTSPTLSPVGRPSIIRSTDGRSFLIAFQQSAPAPARIGLLRADCVP